MDTNKTLSRHGFVGSLAAALGYLGLGPKSALWAQTGRRRRPRPTEAEYDAFAKLSSNENPYGPSDAVMEAMNHAFKYANRYGYPDGNVLQAIAEHHGVEPENVLLGAGSGEILNVVGQHVPAGSQEGRRRRAFLRLGVPARERYQGRRHQTAASP